ncbi:LuxR C-terminal-related transcriptional regulator [Paractinoplanes rishiriensis]|uniref:Helix-turn-helix transcriptional regulator n=1 Tax=Paractinoplanes rishiriensis TaxID=1050105 RepID=A0A919MZB1_9ACTN|nr:LuxR C-terminal-related transcriptional regulator [Actinoplanes rishiriensis]GIF01289.1 helix-turn-helix transcriptional regulator [Actinoplanes rishiriensis]
MPQPVLATKLFAPPQRAQLVARPRLMELLDATLAPGHRLTVVSAPAGFGKTTLLSDWRATLVERPTAPMIGWVSLDAGDNDLSRLLTHLLAALEVGAALLDAVPAASAGAVLPALVNELARLGDGPRVVVLDDYHVVESAPVHEAVTFLLDHLPPTVHLLVATRADPPLPLARLRSRGQLVEVRAADLRFRPSEVREFLTRVMGLELSAADVAALDGRTEGWAAGLQLAALSLRGVDDPKEVAGFIDAFTGSHRFVIDYLADEVLARQPGHVREFLLRTAVLDRLTGPLCDAVTGRAGGRLALDDLDRANLFVVPLDGRRDWYRYHHLFADVLRARLLSEQPGEVPQLHRRACDWYAAHDLVADAVRHALAADDVTRAAALMEQAVPELRRTRQDRLLQDWMRALPDAVVRRSPVLSIVSGWSSLISGDLDGLESRLDDAEAALTAGEHDEQLRAAWVDTEDLRSAPAMIAVYRASLAQARHDVAGTVRHAQVALDLAGPEDHFVRGAGAGFLGLAAWAAGDVQQALPMFTKAVRSLHAAGNLVDELDSTVVLADMWVAAGWPSRARRLYEQALRTAVAGGEPYPRATADLHVGLAELNRQRDELAVAEEHLRTARALAEHGSITENRHRWFLAMARLRAVAGDHDATADLLDRAQELYRPGFYPDVHPIAATRARLALGAGDLTAAGQWAEEAGVTVDDEPAYLREYELLTLVRVLLARHRAGDHHAPVPAVLALLERLRVAAEDRAGSLREIHLLRALAHHADGDTTRAFAALSDALTARPEADSYVRLFLDEGAPMQALLRDAVAGLETPARQRLGVLLGRSAASRPAAEPPQPVADRLSSRELEVLRLLDSDLTGPEIARRLYVTVNTLRTHTKRIFTKLDVTTRAAAVRRAREYGLL